MSEKILSTRIQLKVDTLENWQKSTLGLKKGELALATVAASAGTGLTEPVVMIKVGEDGVKTFSQLEWNVYAKASDVLSACKTEKGLTDFINGVIADAGIATDEALSTLAGRVDTAEDDIDALQADLNTAETGLKARMTTAEDAIDALEELVGDKAVATQISTAIAELKLAETYAPIGAPAQALTDANAYTDEKNTAMNTRVEALEAIDHDHSNKGVLDGITAAKVSAWDAAEQNAKTHANDLNTNMNTRVEALEDKFGDGEGNVESQIAAAVKVEKERAEGIESGLRTDVDAIKGDYLKAADKTALQDQITSNDGDITDLKELVGDTAVASQINTAVEAEAKIARAAEEKNAADIKAISDDYLKAADKEELQGNIDSLADGAVKSNTEAIAKLNANAETEGSVDYKIAQKFATLMENPDDAMNSIQELVDWTTEHAADALEMSNQVTANKNAIATLNGDASTAGSVDKKIADAIADYATDGELSALAGRVTTVESDLNTENTGLKAKMAAAESDIDALQEKVGDKTVAVQISEAIAEENLAQYAKASDLTALDGRVVTVEGKAHEHANKAELDKIADGDKAKWDAKVDSVTAAADSGLKATRTDNAVAIAIDDTITWVFDCGDSGVTA
jgi:hypothetical protein